jgi:hypothetical protein
MAGVLLRSETSGVVMSAGPSRHGIAPQDFCTVTANDKAPGVSFSSPVIDLIRNGPGRDAAERRRNVESVRLNCSANV